jgi:hypothetical protein
VNKNIFFFIKTKIVKKPHLVSECMHKKKKNCLPGYADFTSPKFCTAFCKELK